MTTTTSIPADSEIGKSIDRLTEELAGIRAQESRVDGKAFSQLAATLVLGGGTLTCVTTTKPAGPAAVLWAMVALTLVAAAAQSARAVLPRLGGASGFMRYAKAAGPEEVVALVRAQVDDSDGCAALRRERELAEQVGQLSRNVHDKYRAIRWAWFLLAPAVIVAVAATITLAAGR